MLTREKAEKLSLPIDAESSVDILLVENALAWIADNTTVKVDMDDLENVQPAVRLFIIRYIEIMQLPMGISSESASGLSQSFDTNKDPAELLISAAEAIFGADNVTAGAVHFVTAKRGWDMRGS